MARLTQWQLAYTRPKRRVHVYLSTSSGLWHSAFSSSQNTLQNKDHRDKFQNSIKLRS